MPRVILLVVAQLAAVRGTTSCQCFTCGTYAIAAGAEVCGAQDQMQGHCTATYSDGGGGCFTTCSNACDCSAGTCTTAYEYIEHPGKACPGLMDLGGEPGVYEQGVQKCASSCDANGLCVGFFWDAVLLTCQLSSLCTTSGLVEIGKPTYYSFFVKGASSPYGVAPTYIKHERGACSGENDLGIFLKTGAALCEAKCNANDACISFEYSSSLDNKCQLSSTCTPDRSSWIEGGTSDPWTTYMRTQFGANGDPHLALPHGGRADFRGEHQALYNLLSAEGLSLNVMTEVADFELHKPDHHLHKDVHGSFLTQAHIVARTNTGKTVRASFWADAIGEAHLGFANGTVDSEPAFKIGPKMQKRVDDVTLMIDYSNLRVITPKFEIEIKPRSFRLERNVVGLRHRLDVQFKLRVAEDKLGVPPHGIIGQGWDGDSKAIDGEVDLYPITGEFTTYAMAKGAIEGVPNDYKMASPYATDFKYSRYDAVSAAPRDVAKLVSQGALNQPKQVGAAFEEAVGSTEYFAENDK